MKEYSFAGVGRIEWIGLSPGTRQPLLSVPKASAVPGTGLDDDYHAGRTRQVTLVQAEHLPLIASLCGRAEVTPYDVRRNVVVSGINLVALIGRRFRLGDAVLEGAETCDPCHRMEANLGPGGFAAMTGMGGLIANVVDAGELAVGDAVEALPQTLVARSS